MLRYVRAAAAAARRGAQVGAGVLPVEQVAEVAAVVTLAGRVRAVAARFEQHTGQWRCVAFRIL